MQHALSERHNSLTQEIAGDLLKQRGYAMKITVSHVHATDGKREWHICRLEELHSMGAVQFLACLDEALAWLSSLDEASDFHERNALFANLPAGKQTQATAPPRNTSERRWLMEPGHSDIAFTEMLEERYHAVHPG